MKIDAATPEDIRDVALRMRDSDYREFSALSWTDSRETLAEELVARYGYMRPMCVTHRDGERVAVGDVIQVRPNVVSLFFFATDRFGDVALPLTRFVAQRLLRNVRDAGVHRIEALTSATHAQAHRWLRTLGLRQEGVHFRGFGKNGESYVQFAWVRESDDVRS
ncbi:MAG: hypothetical protein HYU59_05755 [Magnetospirillum gryphiswaldense]|nr:hypothetical protein [Magnetospirillum gryphiswaldense]